MAYTFRLLKWLCFAALLAAVGVPVFHLVRHRPRCTIAGIGDVQHLSADGSRLVTLRPQGDNTVWLRGPLQVWDTHSGQVDFEFFGDVGVDWLESSPDGGTFAVSLNDGALHLVDIRLKESQQVDGVQRQAGMRFSSDGGWLWVSTTDEQSTCFIDVPARKAALRLAEPFAAFSSDGRLAFVRNESDLDVWELKTGVEAAAIATGPGFVMANDEGLLVFRPASGKAWRPGERVRENAVDLWDLATFTRRWRWQQATAGNLQAVFSPDEKVLAVWLDKHSADSELALLDTATGRRLWSTTVKNVHAGAFSEDGALWFVWHTKAARTLTVFEAATGDVLWDKPGQPLAPRFLGLDHILHHERGTFPTLLNGTGQVIAALPLHPIRDDNPDAESAILDLNVTPDGRYFAYAGWTLHKEHGAWRQWLETWRLRLFGDDSYGVAVMESATGRELCRVVGAGRQRHLLSDDAGTLVTVDGPSSDKLIVRVWDVSAAKAWSWSLATAAAVGCLVLALRWRWRRRQTFVKATPSTN